MEKSFSCLDYKQKSRKTLQQIERLLLGEMFDVKTKKGKLNIKAPTQEHQQKKL